MQAIGNNPASFEGSRCPFHKKEANVQPSSQIIYASIRPNHLGVYQRTLSGQTKLIGAKDRFETHPVATPDGKAVIYSSNGSGSHHLFIRSLETGKEYKLTNHQHFEDQPRFDGSGYLYFCSDFSGSMHIYRIKWKDQGVDMAQAEKITDGPGNHLSFCLSPNGNDIVYCSNKDNLEAYQGPSPTPEYQAGRLFKMTIGKPETCAPLIEKADGHGKQSWEGTPAYSKDGRYIFYYAFQSGKPQLYRYEAATKQIIRVTRNEAKALYPMAASENQILFSYQKCPDKHWKIKSMQLDGTGLKTQVKMGQHCWAPSLMPDGSLAFYGTTNLEKLPDHDEEAHGEGSFVVDEGVLEAQKSKVGYKTIRGFFPAVDKKQGKIAYIEAMRKIMQCNLDGSLPEELYTSLDEKNSRIFGLSKSLDGAMVTTAGTPFGTDVSHIYLLNEAQRPVNLTAQYPAARNATPAISQDGQSIVFSRQEIGGRKHLFSMDRAGKELKQLTSDAGLDDVFPAISPDKKLIAFSSTADKKTYQIRLLNLEDGSIKTLTPPGFVDIHVCFSPDGKKLSFSSNRGGHKVETPQCFFFGPQPYGDIYILDIESGIISPFTSTHYEDSTPTWI